jgi:hypothetical protein
MAKKGHALVIGGTGMLRGLVLWLAERHETVTVVSRRRSVPGTNAVHLDWHDTAALRAALAEATAAHGSIELAVCWIHSTAPEAIDVVAEAVLPDRIFQVLGSGHRDSAYRKVRLGRKGSRWLTDEEISAGAIEAVEKDAHDHQVGEPPG